MSVDIGAKQKSEPNVVPLCDILLVLLIIFMVITPVMQKGIDVKLPETQTPGDDPIDPNQTRGIVLTLESDRTVKINTDSVDMNLLENTLRDLYQTRTDKTIFIRADESLNYQDVLRIIDIAKGAGIEVLGVIPERYKSGN